MKLYSEMGEEKRKATAEALREMADACERGLTLHDASVEIRTPRDGPSGVTVSVNMESDDQLHDALTRYLTEVSERE